MKMLIIFFLIVYLYLIVPGILIIFVFAIVFKTSITNIISRFFSVLNEKLTLSIITTGRSDLWTIYINEITSSIPNMLIGVGLFSKRVIDIGPHNLLIHLLYRMGFIGVFMIGVLAYYYYRDSHKTLKPTIYTAMPIFVFILISMVENFL